MRARLLYLLVAAALVLLPARAGVAMESYPSATTFASPTITGTVSGTPTWDSRQTFPGVTSTASVLLSDGTAAAPALAFSNQGSNDGLYYDTVNGNISVSFGGSQQAAFDGGASRFLDITVAPGSSIGWGASTMFSSKDLQLVRDAAGVLAQRNGTNAQEFRIYNTYTDANNYERLRLGWSSNVAEIISVSAGTGTARNLRIGTTVGSDILFITGAGGGADRWIIAGTAGAGTTGDFLAGTDNSWDIGRAAANRPRNVFVGTGFGAAGLSGVSATYTIRDGGGAADCNLVFTGGILTSSTC